MKAFRFIVVSMFFAAVLAVSSYAQTTAKIGLINTTLFEDEKQGISKFISARKSVNDEFKKDFADLTTLATRIQTLEKEITALQTQIQQQPNNTALTTSYTTKTDEYGKLGREFEFKQTDAKARYQRREQAVLGPVLLDIGKAMDDYAKQKAYSMLLDSAKLFNAGVLLAWTDTTDVTVDFIKFYNARPATATK